MILDFVLLVIVFEENFFKVEVLMNLEEEKFSIN